MQLLDETPVLRVYYDEQQQWLYAQWHGDLTQTAVRQGCDLLLAYQQSGTTTKLLNDNSRIEQPWPEGIVWGARVWLPVMVQAGLRHIAWVYSTHLISRLLFDRSQPDVCRPIAAAFDDVAQAVEWLQQQQHCPLVLTADTQQLAKRRFWHRLRE